MTASTNPWAALLPPVAHTPDGLETITDVLVALSDGAPVPQRAAEHLAQALRPCLTGDNDIAGRLGLRAPRRDGAHEAPVALAKNLQRDSLVRSVVANMGPPKATSALALQMLWSYFYTHPQDPADHAGRSRNFPLLCELAGSHGEPLSHRQILRIANGETAYTRRCKK